MQGQYNISPITEYSIIQTMKWLQSEFVKFTGSTLTIKAVTGASALRQISAQQDRPDVDEPQPAKLTYPFMLYSVGDFSRDGDRGGFNKPQKRGIVVSKDIDNAVGRTLDLTPVKIGIGGVLNTSNFREVVSFFNMLMYHGPKIAFIMEVENTSFRIATTLTLPESLTFPSVNYESPGEAYQYESLFILDTYVGIEREQRLIRNIKFGVKEATNIDFFFQGDVTGDVEELVSRNIKYTEYYDAKKTTLYGDKDVNS